MNTYRVRLLYQMLREIKAGTWQPTIQCTFDQSTVDWYDNPPEASHLAEKVSGGRANVVGCAGVDQRFIDLGFRLMGDGTIVYKDKAGWQACCAFFEEDSKLDWMLLSDMSLDNCLVDARSLCQFWVKHDLQPTASFVWGPGDVLLSSTLQPEQADWVVGALNEALDNLNSREAFKLWGVEA